MLETRRRVGPLFLTVVLGHVVLISAQVNTPSGARALEVAAFGVVSELQRATAAVLGGIERVWAGYVALRGLREENDQLRRRVAELQLRLQEEQALARQSRTLAELLGLRAVVAAPTLSARVIAADPTAVFRTLTIDRGSRDGVRRDLAVIAPAGVVGRIVGEPGPHAAKVQLLVDRTAAAGALVERSRAAGVVVGGDAAGLRMEYVSNVADVRPGDLVVTSGIDGIYPRGFAIGRVEHVERGAGVYKTIRIRPAVEFAALEEVLVVMAPPPPAAEASR